jgi:hypothetical protein
VEEGSAVAGGVDGRLRERGVLEDRSEVDVLVVVVAIYIFTLHLVVRIYEGHACEVLTDEAGKVVNTQHWVVSSPLHGHVGFVYNVTN